MEFLRENCNLDIEKNLPVYVNDNLNIVNNAGYQRQKSNNRKIEYREKLEEEKGYHKKAKSQRGNKFQYIRNNHDIMTRHQRQKSSDSSENSILKRSNGFEILYKRGEKIDRLLGNYDSYDYSKNTSYLEDMHSNQSTSGQEESSSISNIGKYIRINYI